MTKIFLMLFLSAFSFAAYAGVRSKKNIFYSNNTDIRNTLNVYYPSDIKQGAPVLVFVHGGSWSSGKKETYWWLGRNFASKGIVTVIINYTLAPQGNFERMASDCATAVKWVASNIAAYKGDPGKIFMMGHSAGGHLSELINSDARYFKQVGITNPIKGMILNDPFGLDIHEYMTKAARDNYYTNFLRTFTADPEQWKTASPMTYVRNIRNPHLIFYGENTYEAIRIQAPRLNATLKEQGISSEITEIPVKKHVGMMSQMILRNNRLYPSIVDFMNKISATSK